MITGGEGGDTIDGAEGVDGADGVDGAVGPQGSNGVLDSSYVDIDTAEAIMRVEQGSKVSKLSSKELRRDLLVFARKKPKLFFPHIRYCINHNTNYENNYCFSEKEVP